jgi:IMP cyclohydrolase
MNKGRKVESSNENGCLFGAVFVSAVVVGVVAEDDGEEVRVSAYSNIFLNDSICES